MRRFFVFLVTLVVGAVRAVCRSRADLVVENLALRQQVTALKQRRPRPPLDDADRGFWVALRACWPGWTSRLVLVKPDTVVKWHQQRFWRYWTRLSHRERRPGRPRVSAESRRLIREMAVEDGWGAPRIHGELRKLGFVVSETTVSRHMPRKPADPDQVRRWVTLLRRELLEHVVVLGECHLVRLVRSYLAYYHEDRTHLGLAKDSPAGRKVESRPSPTARLVALPRVGGLHHRYEWRDAG